MKLEEKIIGINSLFLIPGKVGGTEIFFRKQIEELSRIKTKNQYLIYTNKENGFIFNGLPKNFKLIHTGVTASNRLERVLWEQFILPFWLYRDKVDLLHSPGYTTPIFTHCKKITTIFDLNYYFHPEDFNFLQRIVFSIIIPLSAYSSNKIIVHSNKAKEEMVSVLGVNKNKIDVIYGGVSDDFKEKISYDKSIKEVSKFKINPPYILANSTSHPHKNLKSLVLAFVELSKSKKFKHNLVLIGIHGKAHHEMDGIIKENKIENRVQFTGWIDHSKMIYFNRLADIFVVPSLYEGFGLPIAEAMACGVPLIASKYSCIPEIVGSGGIIIDVKNPKLIAKSIVSLLKSEKLREKLSKLGRERAKIFSWKELGQKIYNLYNA